MARDYANNAKLQKPGAKSAVFDGMLFMGKGHPENTSDGSLFQKSSPFVRYP